MVERIIVWTSTSKKELKYILEFFNFRNKSKTYSKKIQTELKLLLLQPNIGKKTDSVNVRGLLIEKSLFVLRSNLKLYNSFIHLGHRTKSRTSEIITK